MIVLPTIKRLDWSTENIEKASDWQTENQLAMIEISGIHSKKSMVVLRDSVENFKLYKSQGIRKM